MGMIKKELKKRSAYTGLLLAIGTFLLNGKVNTIEIGKLGVIPVIIASGIVQLLMSVLPSVKENDKKQNQILIKKLSFFIAAIQAFIVHSSLTEASFQVLDTLMLAQISDEITDHGISNGISSLFIIQILKDAFAQSHIILQTTSLIHLASIGGLMLPLILFSFVYHNKEQLVEMNSKTHETQTTHQITKNISVTLNRRDNKKTYLPIRVAACGTSPIMHSLSFFIFLGLGPKWLWSYAVLLIFTYVLEMCQSINTYEIAKQLKKFQYTIKSIRPGEDTRKYLNRCVKKAIAMGIPFILVMGFYPFIFFKCVAAFSFAKSIPFLVNEAKIVLREVESYNLDLRAKGVLV